jgi:hypothetical protein
MLSQLHLPAFIFSRYQSSRHIKASIVLGVRELRLWVTILQLELNVDSEATEDTGIARISQAIKATSG